MVLPGCPPNAYTSLTISVTPARAGQVRVDPDLSQYPPQTEVTLEAVPDEGWVFSNWIGTGFNTSTATTKLIMNRDQAVTAVFAPKFEEEGEDESEGEEEPVLSNVQDGGFEEGPDSAAWTQASTLYNKIICSEAQCGLLEGMGPYNGEYWAYFGTLDGRAETAQLEQTLTMPSMGCASLWFHIAVPAAEVGFEFQVAIVSNDAPGDPEVLFEINEAHASVFSDYKRVEVDASAYANGGTYTLQFKFTNETGSSAARIAVFLDDVSVTPGS